MGDQGRVEGTVVWIFTRRKTLPSKSWKSIFVNGNRDIGPLNELNKVFEKQPACGKSWIDVWNRVCANAHSYTLYAV
jgi:hypothetical protein